MEVNVEAVVVGGGPAGSTLAALLASRGAEVAAIDRDTFPRDKVCGEFLSYDALPLLDRLGVTSDLDAEAAPSIARSRVNGRRTVYEFELPRPARGVSRALLDRILFRRAVGLGAADWSGWTATQLDGSSVTVERNGERRVIRARVVAGAWGRWGRFDKQLGRRFVRDRAHRSFGFKRHYLPLATSQETIDLYSFRRGYLGVSPIEGGLTNICGLVHASRLAGHRGRWDAFVGVIRQEETALDRLFAAHEPVQNGFLSSDPVVFRARTVAERGVLMVGDASGVVDPLTGNGIAMAVQSAVLAAPAVLQLLGGGDRRKIERAYAASHRRLFAARIAWSRRIARLLSRPALLDATLRLIRDPRAGEFLLARTRASTSDLDRLAASRF